MRLIPRLKQYRNLVAVAHDTIMAALSFILSLYLRLGEAFLAQTQPYLLLGTAVFTLICVGFFLRMRLYKGIWRYASLSDLLAIIRAATLSILVFVPVLFLLTRLEGYPRSALVINWLLLVMLLGAPRLIYRIVRDRGFHLDLTKLTDDRVPVLLVGSGDQAELFIRNSLHKDELPYRVVGIVANEPSALGRNLHGIRVHGMVDELPKVVDKLSRKDQRPHKIILAEDGLSGDQVQEMLRFADSRGMSLARLPKLTDLRQAADEPMQLAPIAIEDLLGRPQAALDMEQMEAFLTGKKVLITGAGGTIGSELARQVAQFAPQELVLFELSEFALYRIDREIGDECPGLVRHAVLGDVRHEASVERLFATYQPDVVFHAGAVKHVPIAEANPLETVRTNVVGTVNIAEAARRHQTSAVVLVSTDKAVNPANVMGASKRFSELYLQALSAEAPETSFITVRFGNVLGSAGSVVPLFRRQLEAGGPLTVTHPQMERYFMTVREAVELVIQAASMQGSRKHHGPGAIFVLDMGKPVRIMDLAEQMIRLAGYRPYRDIEIEITGLRPGEKLYEELFYTDEAPVPTQHESIMLAMPREIAYKAMRRQLMLLEQALEAGRADAIRVHIAEIVREYRPAGGAAPLKVASH